MDRSAKESVSQSEEAGKAGKTWKGVRALAQNRVRWRCFVEGLCSGQE
jgi:hypothetical protein